MNSRLMLIIGGIAAGILVVVIFVYGLRAQHTSAIVTPAPNSSVDPNSGQTISDPAGKAPDTYGRDPKAPVMLGFGSLLDHGLSSDQLTATEQAFTNFAEANNRNITQVSINVSSVTGAIANQGTANSNTELLFDVVTNKSTTYHATLVYSNLSDIDLTLNDKNNVKAYDSGTISPNSND